MSTWYKWKVKCSVESFPNNIKSVITESAIAPTVCPDDNSHPVSEAFVIDHRKLKDPQLNEDGEERRVLVSPGLFPDYMNPYYTSSGDNLTAGTRGDGVRLVYSHANGASETNSSTFRLLDYVQILGGQIRVSGSNPDDYLTFECSAPATNATPNGANTGNCNLYDLGMGGPAMIIPAAGDGTHDVDLTTPINANVAGGPGQPTLITQAVPVTASKDNGESEGFWNWNRVTGEITAAPNQDGAYNLYNFPIKLSRYVNKLCVYSGEGCAFKQKLLLVHRGGPFLPHWTCTITTTRASSHAAEDPPVVYSVVLIVARKSSTNLGE